MNTSSLLQKVWNFCHTLRDDGVGYGDYLDSQARHAIHANVGK